MDLEQQAAFSDRMDAPTGNVDALTGRYGDFLQDLFQSLFGQGLLKGLLVYPRGQSGVHTGPGGRIEHVPHLGFCLTAVLAGGPVIGMHLYAQALLGIDQLDQQGEGLLLGTAADQRASQRQDQLVQRGPRVLAVRHDAHPFGAI